MAGRKKTGRRIEPSFDDGKARSGGFFSVSASDRVAGGGKPKKPVKKKPVSTRRKTKGAKRRGGGSRKGRRGVLGLLRGAFYWCFVLGVWCAIGVGGLVAYYAAQMPNASTWAIPDRPPNVRIVSVGGEVLANRGVTGGEALSLDEMSPFIPQAVISIEDRRFYSHFGVDPIGLARALVTNLIEGRTVEGGSTLTQQLAKNLFLSPERTLERKVQEVLLALWLEHRFSKDQILELYLNRVYFGSGAYGVQAAARRYFHEPARDVTLAQAALLAGLLKAPSRLSPLNDPEAAKDRADVVLAAMRDTGFVTDRQIVTAKAQKPAKTRSYRAGSENYVADMVMKALPGLIGDVKQDIVVTTTVDAGLQRDGEAALKNALADNGEKRRIGQGALVSLDGTGAVRALIGGRDYAASQYNRAADARRQPGSAFKPFVYTAAMEMGRTPQSIRNDAPIRIGKWTPENYEHSYEGPVTLDQALTHSINTVAAQLVMEAGPKTVVSTAHRMGIDSDIKPNASIALGTSEVSLLELTSAYAPFMNGGFRAPPYVVESVATVGGKVLYRRGENGQKRVLDPRIIAEMDTMLESVVKRGTGRKAALDGWQTGGKTGTTQNSRDALFVGFTANLVSGVWFGNDDGTPMKHVTGGTVPAETWHTFMAAAHRGLSPAPLPYSDIPVPVTVPGSKNGNEEGGNGQRLPPVDTGRPVAGVSPRAPRNTGATPVPPGNVGEAPPRRKSSLLDVLLGR